MRKRSRFAQFLSASLLFLTMSFVAGVVHSNETITSTYYPDLSTDEARQGWNVPNNINNQSLLVALNQSINETHAELHTWQAAQTNTELLAALNHDYKVACYSLAKAHLIIYRADIDTTRNDQPRDTELETTRAALVEMHANAVARITGTNIANANSATLI